MIKPLDRRLTPARPDLAAEWLRGSVEAERFVPGERRKVRAAYADLRRSPQSDAPLETQLLHAEPVIVFDETEGWAWLQAERDGYVGYAVADALGPPVVPATHKVIVNRSFIYPAPDMKRATLGALPLGAEVSVDDLVGSYARIDGGWMFAAHLAAVDTACPDFVAVAEGLIGAPYLWGGKTPAGIDCSGLVQLSLTIAHVAFPRDSDLQAEQGIAIGKGCEREPLRRGDLVFWPGHVGIMQDAATLLHANAHHMLVASEPLSVAETRINGAVNNNSAPYFSRITVSDLPQLNFRS